MAARLRKRARVRCCAGVLGLEDATRARMTSLPFQRVMTTAPRPPPRMP